MKKFDFKIRMQWGFFRAALVGMGIAALIAPSAGRALGIGSLEEPVQSAMDSAGAFINGIFGGNQVKILINGEVVALAKNEKAAREAYNLARLSYNAEGVKILDIDVSYEAVNRKEDAEALRGMHLQRNDKLKDTITQKLSSIEDKDKALAYTLRVDDYTITIQNLQDVVGALEQAQSQYDTEDHFQVDLKTPSSRNVTMYEVGVSEKSNAEEGTTTETQEATQTEEAEPATSETTEQNTEAQEESAQEATVEEDGIKYVGFSETIQVQETYVDKSQIKDKDTAYAEITAENEEPSIYVVAPGDCLSVIAEKNNMSVEEIKELNPGIESDDNLYYDDRLNIHVPVAAVQVLVEKQETYEEDYYADTVYEDDGDMFIGETEVVQEGEQGHHTVTDLVTYKGDIECNREQLAETVQVAAVAQIVRRGTKSKPTYMYPVTNWNVTSTYGYRWGRLHAGTDVGVPIGTTVRASRSGQVVTAGWVGGYGNCVMIDHGDGIWTVYGHLSEITVSVGQYVNQGDQIALSGNTGRSTGPHLHFEVRVNGSAVDATPYLEGRN